MYEGQADIYLTNVEEDPELILPGGPLENVGLSILTYDRNGLTDSTVKTATQIYRARLDGLYASPAMRVYPYDGNGDPAMIALAASKGWWDGVASVMRQVKGLADDGRVAIDVEDYGPTIHLDDATLASLGMTVADLEQNMAAFLLEIQNVNICMYPVNVNDHAHRAILQGAESAEGWIESFALSTRHRTDLDAFNRSFQDIFAEAESYRQVRPDIRIRLGLRDDAIRGNMGHTIRSAVAAGEVGTLQPWLFDYYRGDRWELGNAEWVAGTWLDSRNDIAHAWDATRSISDDVCASLWCGDSAGVRSIFGNCVAEGYAPEVGPNGGHVMTTTVTNKTGFIWSYCNTVPTDEVFEGGPTTAEISISIPGGLQRAALLGIHEDLLVYVDGDELWLWSSTGTLPAAPVAIVPRDTLIAIAVAWDNDLDFIRVVVATEDGEDAQPYLIEAPGLNISGNDNRLYAARGYDGTLWMDCRGCEVVGGLHVWDRALNCNELSGSRPGDIWPWNMH